MSILLYLEFFLRNRTYRNIIDVICQLIPNIQLKNLQISVYKNWL